jgi:hypothetical protein
MDCPYFKVRHAKKETKVRIANQSIPGFSLATGYSIRSRVKHGIFFRKIRVKHGIVDYDSSYQPEEDMNALFSCSCNVKYNGTFITNGGNRKTKIADLPRL